MIEIKNIELNIKGTVIKLSLEDVKRLQVELNKAFPIYDFGYWRSPWWCDPKPIVYGAGGPKDYADAEVKIKIE